MNAFLGISLWIALATVIPGLVTIAVVSMALGISSYDISEIKESFGFVDKDWIAAAIAITIMILTQFIGILIEEFILRFRLFPGCSKVKVPNKINGNGKGHINAYEQYSQVYILLAQLKEDEDAQGHLKRTVAQFFLTNNTLVSFLIGLIVSISLSFNYATQGLTFYTIAVGACFILTYYVAVIRFKVMSKSIWATCMARDCKIIK